MSDEDGPEITFEPRHLKAIELAVAQERGACVRLLDRHAKYETDPDRREAIYDCRDIIRKRDTE